MSVDKQTTRTTAVWRAFADSKQWPDALLDVVRNRNHFESSLWQAAEELRQSRLHRGEISPVYSQ